MLKVLRTAISSIFYFYFNIYDIHFWELVIKKQTRLKVNDLTFCVILITLTPFFEFVSSLQVRPMAQSKYA